MKKLLTFSIAVMIAFTGIAQGKSQGKGHKDKSEKHNKSQNNRHNDDDDDDYRNNDRRERDHKGVYNQNQNNDAKYSKNLPNPVRAAFNRDYPNARNVTWTKNNGYWIATFPNGLYRTTATYSANGQKINGATSKTSPRRTTSSSEDGSIWDKILTKQ